MNQVKTPDMEKRQLDEKHGIGVRDLITCAIFTVIYFIIFFACGMTEFVPIMAFLFPLPIALISGIPQMLFYTKVRSFGMVTIMGALLGLISFLMGLGPIALCFGVACGFIADVVLRAGGYKSLKCSIVSHCVFSLWIIGTMLPMWILGQAYFEPYRASQGDAYIDELLAYMSGGMLVTIIVGIVACALVGAAFGTKVLRKHFQRAGIV